MKKVQIQSTLRYQSSSEADYVFNIQAANHPWQIVDHEKVIVDPFNQLNFGLGHTGQNKLARMHSGAGVFNIIYEAQVSVNYPLPIGNEQEMPISQLPIDVIPYIWSSRYCESDALLDFTNQIFAPLPSGFSRVEAICQWIRNNISYQPGRTNSITSSRNVLDMRAGVCRDFAHLGISFCRALNIPARFVTGYAKFSTPPNDFHAIFEAYLGHRWVLFDPTQMSPVEDLVRIGTGRDASDTAFSTIFGNVQMISMDPAVTVFTE